MHDQDTCAHSPDELHAKDLARTDRERALALVVQLHRPRLLRHATSILKDRDLAHDIVQDVFIKAMHEPRFFDPDFRMGAWLYRVTNNLCLNTVRDHRRRGDILAGLAVRPVTDPRQDDEVLARQRRDHLASAMERLSENHRRILQERFYRDLSYTEIAEVLDIQLGTVMSRLSRARATLLKLLEGEAPAEW